jgi:DNA modification methylase
MIADNRLTENAVWDERLLAEQLKGLSEVELDFSLEATGFEMGEIDIMIEGLATSTDAGQDVADVLPKVGDAVPVSKPGDLWLLGKNRLICGDALKENTYASLMDGRHANAVFADPPYNDPIDGYVNGFGKVHHNEFAMASGEMTSAEFTQFLSKAFARLVENSEDGALHFICIDWRHAKELIAAGEPSYSEFKNLCVWVKDSGGQGSLYRSQHELVFVFKSGSGKHRNNIQLGQYGRYRTNIWQYPRVNALSSSNEEPGLATVHPTIKPVALVSDAILDCTARGDIVLDPFSGSGTTFIAAERTGRICYGIELDPKYVDVAIRRWQAFTKKTAIHFCSGMSFASKEVAHG